MSLYTTLQGITTTSQSNAINAQNAFMVYGGPQGLLSFFTSQAQKGETSALLHCEKGINPRSRNSGFATLSGQLGVLNAEPTTGVVKRNDVGWFYFNMDTCTEAQFLAEVDDVKAYLISEGLIVTIDVRGSIMADLMVSWA